MSRPLTVLHVAPCAFPLPYGSQVHVAARCAGLVARGHRVRLACYGRGEGEAPRGVEIVRTRRVPGDEVRDTGPYPARLPLDLLLARTVRRALADVDVVHAHNVEGPVVARLAGARVPVVYEQHTAMEDELPSHGGGRLARLAGRWVDRAVPALADAVVALTEAGASRVRHRRVVVIPPSIDPAEVRGGDAARARARWGLRGPVVLYAGNLDAYQGLSAVLGAELGATLLVLSTSPCPGAVWARWEGLDSLRDALAVADVAVVPRTLPVGFPIKLLNALAAGVPAVVAGGEPIPGAVVDADVASAVRALVADPERRRALGAAGAAHVASAWSHEARAIALEGLYADLLG